MRAQSSHSLDKTALAWRPLEEELQGQQTALEAHIRLMRRNCLVRRASLLRNTLFTSLGPPTSFSSAAADSAKEVLYLNRSAARLALRDWHGAEQDADASLKLAEAAGKPGSWKAFLRRGVGHRQRAMCAEKDLLKAMQLAPLTEKRRVAAELSLNYSMKQMGLNTVGSEYGLPDGRVQHIGHPKYSENMNMFAGAIARAAGSCPARAAAPPA